MKHVSTLSMLFVLFFMMVATFSLGQSHTHDTNVTHITHDTHITCHQSPIYIYSDPATNQSVTAFCGATWAVALSVSPWSVGELGGEILATGFIPDHTCNMGECYLPVRSRTVKRQCLNAHDGTRQCLKVKYGKTGTSNGFTWAWVTLTGTESGSSDALSDVLLDSRIFQEEEEWEGVTL